MKPTPEKVPEVELGRVVVAWLEADGWDVWQEVGVSTGGGVCDIVAKRGPVIHAVECKTVANLGVLEQALGWVGCAHFVSVAVPNRRKDWLYTKLAGGIGVGVLWVGQQWRGESYALDVLSWSQGPMARPHRNRFARPLASYLTPERKHWPAEAGNNLGHRYTPFRETCEYLRRVVAAEPGITMREAVAKMQAHHYHNDKAARATLMQWVRAKKIPGIRYEYRDGARAASLYLDADSPAASEVLAL